MKKLLALILCVMLFVSVIPTAAFAADAVARASGEADNPLLKAAEYKKEIANMIANTKANIQTAYGVLVMDQTVYASAKTLADTIVGMVDALSKKLIEDGKMPKAVADTAKDSVRALLDSMVAKTLNDKAYKYTNADGSKDPVKFAQTFAAAVTSALTNKDFQKGYEDVATYFALAGLIDSVKAELQKQYAIFDESIDADFDAAFAAMYPELAESYIDTLADMANFEDLSTANPWLATVTPVVGAVS